MFEETKAKCLEKLRIEQEKMNPGRPNTAALNEAIAKKDWGEGNKTRIDAESAIFFLNGLLILYHHYS